MNNIRYRIAALAGGSVLVTLLLVMAAFNVIIQRGLYGSAAASFDSLFLQSSENNSSALYTPEMIFVFGTEEDHLYMPKENSIIQWCGSHPSDKIQKADIGGNTYYLSYLDGENAQKLISVLENGYTVTEDDNDSTIYTYGFASTDNDMDELRMIIAYVDITGELDMIRKINIAFLIAALLTGSLSTALGFVLGKKLEQNQLAQKRFFENTSHELKTPLTSIRGYAEGIGTGVITDYKKTGRVIAEQTEKMSRLIEEILCMAKLESGSVTLEKETVELSAFLQDCLMPFEGTVLTKGLSAELSLDTMTVSADPVKLEHAVSNLLTNALKFAETRISVTCGNGSIRIENDCEQISDETLRHLFDRFYTGRGGNTGIGLSIAKDLIELHGWKLNAVRTENGIGFIISVPPQRGG